MARRSTTSKTSSDTAKIAVSNMIFDMLSRTDFRLILLRHARCAVSQGEIEALYQRFRSLDRGHKVDCGMLLQRVYCMHVTCSCFQGYISAEEFMNIPELSINPLAQRLERIFESVNFKVNPH